MLIVLAGHDEAAPNCWVPHFRTLPGQTVDAYMTVKRGRRCSIVMNSSTGPTYGAAIVARVQVQVTVTP